MFLANVLTQGSFYSIKQSLVTLRLGVELHVDVFVAGRASFPSVGCAVIVLIQLALADSRHRSRHHVGCSVASYEKLVPGW